MTDILFIQPPLVDYDNLKKPITLVNLTFCPPIGIAYLSAYLEERDFTTAVIDMDIEKLGISKIPEILNKYKPRVVGIGIIGDMVYPISFRIIKKIKKLTNIPIVVGGVFPTNNIEQLLKHTEIDFIVKGEGEQTLYELMNYLILKKGLLGEIKGLAYHENGSIIQNPKRDFIKNLDDLPFPAWDKFPIKKYFVTISYKNRSFSIRATRGCVYRCIYCCSSRFQSFRIRSPKNLVDEIQYLNKEYKIKDISFLDDIFNLNNDWVIEFCKELLRRKLKIKWRCNCRVNNINENLLLYMKAAGCYNIILGIESSKDKFLDYLKKDFTIEQVEQAVKLIKKYRIEILAYFMYGIPGQKMEDLQHNIEFIKKLKPDYVSVMILQIFSGTELIKIAQNEGWINKDYSDNFKSPENYLVKRNWKDLPNLNEEILNYYIRKTYLEFFFNFNTLLKYAIRYIRNPSRFLNMIKKFIHGFLS